MSSQGNNRPTEGVNASIPVATTAAAAAALITVSKPDAGVQATYSLTGKKLVFAFDLSTVEVELVDVDIVLRFDDGAQIILLQAGLDLVVDETIMLSFAGMNIPGQALLSQVGEVRTVDMVEVDMTSAEEAGGNTSEQQDKPQVQVVEVPVEVLVEMEAPKAADLDLIDTEIGDSTSDNPRSRIEENLAEFSTRYRSPDEAAAASSSTEDETSVFDLGVSDITVRLLGVTEQVIRNPDASGNTTIEGGAAEEPANVDESFAAQARVEQVNGTDGADVIFADSPRLVSETAAIDAPATGTTRLFEVTVDIPFVGYTPTGATITGLPDGWLVLNAVGEEGGFQVEVDENNPFQLNAQILYELADTSVEPDENGFFDTTTLTIQYDVIDTAGNRAVTTGSTQIVQGFVNSEDDMVFTDPLTGDQVVVLPVNPPGNRVDAGAGDDTIFAAIGADRIDGEAGLDLVNYILSDEAISINLALGSASGGYADGDTLFNVEGLGGSIFDDSLVGSAGDNLFIGAEGADTIDGITGNDTASYEGSEEAVVINLATGLFNGGDATGDILISIENVIGSDGNDVLTGDAQANALTGTLGDDTLAGGIGADTLTGGEGVDLADYSASSAAVEVRLTDGTGIGGDAQGDILSGIENVSGLPLPMYWSGMRLRVSSPGIAGTTPSLAGREAISLRGERGATRPTLAIWQRR